MEEATRWLIRIFVIHEESGSPRVFHGRRRYLDDLSSRSNCGGMHLRLYIKTAQDTKCKYTSTWLARKDKKFLFKNQTLDNMFFSLLSGCGIWTAYEAITLWAYTNHFLPYDGTTEAHMNGLVQMIRANHCLPVDLACTYCRSSITRSTTSFLRVGERFAKYALNPVTLTTRSGYFSGSS